MKSADVVRTYLELTSPEQLRGANIADVGGVVVRRNHIAVDHYRRLYGAVGFRWYWRDRDTWTDERLAEYLAAKEVSVWECLVGRDTAGFFELLKQDDGSVEIAYFGLVEDYFGRGLGKGLLTRAVTEAWALGATRVWLHTCTLDSPHALPNYLARGFQKTHTETYTALLQDD